MNRQANILFIPTSIGGYCAEPKAALSQSTYYQKLIYTSLARSIPSIEGYELLGRKLTSVARHAWATKQLHAVEQASVAMLGLPIAEQLESIARYYQALCTWKRGDTHGARQSLERVVAEAPAHYRSRALQIIGLTYHECGEVDAALPFYLEAGKCAAPGDLTILVETQRTTAVVRSVHGDHKRALAELENLFPAVRAIGKCSPVLYYEYLNSLAVELSEVDRVEEANGALSIALASPFASAYPEWSETRDEIAAKRLAGTSSVVAFSRVPETKPSQKAEPEPTREPSRAPASPWPAHPKGSFQRAIIPNTATAAIPHDGITQSILDRVLICIGSRAPPARF